MCNFSVDVRIFSFNLILSMDFMMKISDFVTNGLATVKEGEVKEAAIEPVPIVKENDPKTVSIQSITYICL